MNSPHTMDDLGNLLPLVGESGEAANSQEILKLLMDEKMRSEHHKANYQTLRAEHLRYINLNKFFSLSC